MDLDDEEFLKKIEQFVDETDKYPIATVEDMSRLNKILETVRKEIMNIEGVKNIGIGYMANTCIGLKISVIDNTDEKKSRIEKIIADKIPYELYKGSTVVALY